MYFAIFPYLFAVTSSSSSTPHHLPVPVTTMLDINDFIAERGGNPEKIRESQRKRHAPEEAVDEVIALFEDHRKSESTSSLSRIVQHATVD